MNRQYNLRSANCDTIQVPVGLQVGDTEFISRVFDKNNHSQNGSNSDSNDSQSDLDCLELLDLSNDDENSKSSNNDLTKNSDTGSHMQASSSSADFSAQSMINQQILDQLQNIGHRLDRLDRKPVKKSSDLKKIESKSKPKQNTDMKERTSMLSSASGVSKNTVGLSDQSVPNLACLRQDMQIHQQVQQRLATLAQQQFTGMDHKVKSQMGDPDLFVKK